MRIYTRILIVALFSILIMDASAQNAGIKIASNWANASLNQGDSEDPIDNQTLITPKLGFIFETPVYKSLFIQTGLYASASGYRYDAKRLVDDENGDPYEVDSKERPILLYIDLPVNFGYKHAVSDELSIFGMVGPVFRYLAYSTHTFKVSGEWDNESTKVEIGGEEKEPFKNFDMGLNIEAGVQYDRFEFSLYYMPSFSNILNDDLIPEGSDAQWKNYSFGLGVGFLFGQIDK